MAYVYLGCFIVGLVISVGSFLFGHDVGDGGGGHDLSGADGSGHHGMPWLNLSSITVFLAWFGGAGYYMSAHARVMPVLVLLIAVSVGFCGAFAIVWFLHQFLLRGNTQMNSADYYMPGTIARVTSSIRNGGVGEIMYVQGGTRKIASAQSDEESAHQQGDEVVIVRYDKGMAHVRSIDKSGSFNGPLDN